MTALAGGAIAALKAEGLDGKVAISGQDAELAVCQRIMEGAQTVTVYKPVRRLAEASAEIAVRLAQGKKPYEVIKDMGHQANKQWPSTEIPSVSSLRAIRNNWE
jgi:ABC-type xylose transport system substrate-binding protein